MMRAEAPVRRAHSDAIDPRVAVRQFHAGLSQDDAALVVFFCSSEYDLNIVADEMNRLFADTPVVGCTTAGEIGPCGYRARSFCGASFSASACTAVTGRLDHLQQFEVTAGQSLVQSLLQQLESSAPAADPDTCFAFLLIDGLSIREEQLACALQTALGTIHLFGGSAGDDLKFTRTCVFHDGAFHTDSAVLILATTPLPFKIFKTQHFVSGAERLVITDADAAKRLVREINGLPAAQEYARVAGVDVHDLNPMRFAATPVVVVIDGMDYVRSIQKANPDDSLKFYCAIDEGLVFRAARGVDLVKNLEQTFDRIREEIGPPQLVFACDCVLRNLEITQAGLKQRVGEILERNKTVGFSTYGEHYRGVHVNQTLTGIAIGSGREASHG